MAKSLSNEVFKKEIHDYSAGGDWNYKGNVPAIIDFYADWCGPCKMVAPIIEELSTKYEGKVNVWKVDTDAEPELSAAFGIQSIPSIMFIPVNGKPQMSMGALSMDTFEQKIRDDLGIDS